MIIVIEFTFANPGTDMTQRSVLIHFSSLLAAGLALTGVAVATSGAVSAAPADCNGPTADGCCPDAGAPASTLNDPSPQCSTVEPVGAFAVSPPGVPAGSVPSVPTGPTVPTGPVGPTGPTGPTGPNGPRPVGSVLGGVSNTVGNTLGNVGGTVHGVTSGLN